VNGEKIINNKALTNYVGIVFQNPDEQVFFPIVEDDIAFGPRNMRLNDKEIRKRVEDALEALDITHLRKRSFLNLSFGEKKKVAFAGILASKPEVVVLDEPTIGIDPWSVPNFLDIIETLKKQSSLIVATHDFNVLKIVDRIYLLWDGKIKAEFSSFDEFYEVGLLNKS
jgi:energy-coupling factor transporter ATP-binding protein EcfA2